MSDSPRVWLIGEQNPYGDRHGHKQRFALYPLPAHASGGRLARILGLTVDEYLDAFERRNLLGPGRWDVKKARAAAVEIRGQVRDGEVLVLCGARAAAAFQYPSDPLRTFASEHRVDRLLGEARYEVLVIPHPSGLSRAWNDPTMAPRVREAVTRLRGRVAAHSVVTSSSLVLSVSPAAGSTSPAGSTSDSSPTTSPEDW